MNDRRCNCCWQDMYLGGFREYTQALHADAGAAYSAVFPTMEALTVTAFVRNMGADPVTAYLQNSPNGCDFTDDPRTVELQPGQMGYLVPYIFSKFMRVALLGSGSACLYFQMQNMR